jgi:hypothetical protein
MNAMKAEKKLFAYVENRVCCKLLGLANLEAYKEKYTYLLPTTRLAN